MILEQCNGLPPNPLQVIYNGINEREQSTTVYSSPFEIFNPDTFKYATYRDLMDYNGCTRQLFFELEEALIGADTYSPARPLHPPRLIRAVIDWKIDHPDQEMERFVLQAIQVGLAVYGQKADALDMVDDFEEKIETHIPKLLGNKVRQDRDLVTWCATQPNLSYNSARQLAFQHSGEDILFIALGHGGVAAGMDVFLRYVDITDRLNSIFYAMRFSRNKHHDLIPKLSPQEIELLTQCSEGKQIVLFDEDVTTGHTLNGARAFLETKLQRNDITLKTNQGHGYSNNHH